VLAAWIEAAPRVLLTVELMGETRSLTAEILNVGAPLDGIDGL